MNTIVSVVIALYNDEQGIAGALASVAAQTHDSLEVIVVDDGSTDKSLDCAAELLAATGLEHHLLFTPHTGPSHARNVGWRTARGAWIQFLDSDDLISPRKIALQLEVARKSDSRVGAVYSDWERIILSADGRITSRAVMHPCLGTNPLEKLLSARDFVHCGAQLFRRDWLETVGGFDETLWLLEDVDLLLRLAMAHAHFEYAPANEPLFWYRQRQGIGLSTRDGRVFAEACVRNARLLEEFWRSRGELTLDRAGYLAQAQLHAARYLADADWAAFVQVANAIQTLDPSFVPVGPRRLRTTAQLIGYKNAERLARWYRRSKLMVPWAHA
jgi:glycosyltransferase involved in cell wall biosynthesis